MGIRNRETALNTQVSLQIEALQTQRGALQTDAALRRPYTRFGLLLAELS